MKIAVDARTLGSKPSGIGMYLNDFLVEFTKYDDIEWVLITDVAESEYIKRFQAMGLKVVEMGTPVYKSLEVYSYFAFVKRELKKINPDVFWEVNNLFPVKLKGNFKTMVTIHDMFPIEHIEYFGRLYSVYFKMNVKKTLKYADMILYNSEQSKKSTEKYYPEAKKIPNCIGYIISNPLSRYVEPKDDNFFLYVGNMEKRKGVDILVKAYRQYRMNGGKRPLILAGKIQEPDIETLIEDTLADVEGFSYLGYVTHTQRYDLYNNCSAFVFPSMAEGFGMPVLEVMKHYKPILVSNLPIFDEVEGECIERFDATGSDDHKVDSLAQSLAALDDKIESKENMVDKEKYREVLERYTPERLGEMVRKFIFGQV